MKKKIAEHLKLGMTVNFLDITINDQLATMQNAWYL